MASKRWILFIASFVLLSFVKAQNKKADSVMTVNTLKVLVAICKNAVIVADSNKALNYAKAASRILRRSEDKKLDWKRYSDYDDSYDKKQVDEICNRINQFINIDSNYRIIQYFTKKKSEGTWHALIISYKAGGVEKKAVFAFLKIGSRFGLGGFDENYK